MGLQKIHVSVLGVLTVCLSRMQSCAVGREGVGMQVDEGQRAGTLRKFILNFWVGGEKSVGSLLKLCVRIDGVRVTLSCQCG